MLASTSAGQHNPARAVLYAADGPGADTRLQNVILEAELAALSPAAGDDDRLRLHRALAANYATLGDCHQALAHGQHELALRQLIQGPGHPDTLTARGDIAHWTGRCGDPAGRCACTPELLPDPERVLGHGHPNTLITRNQIAA